MGRIIVITGGSDDFASLAAHKPAANDDAIAGSRLLDLIRSGSHGMFSHADPFNPLQYADLFEEGAIMSIISSKPAASQPESAPKLLPFYSSREDLIEPKPAIAILMEHRGVRSDTPTPLSVTLDNMSLATELHVASSSRQSWAGWLASLVKRAWTFVQREREVARAMAELRKMADRDLYDIGVERGQIEHIVRHGRAID